MESNHISRRVGGINANTKLIEDGWAWHFRRFNDDEWLAKLDDAARQSKRRLWVDEDSLAPWDYRARQATLKAAPAESQDQKTAYWLNTLSSVRHNQRREHFQKTRQGRVCGPHDRQPCGICGG